MGQVVTCGRYSYEWTGREPLKVGDRVILPGNWLFKYPTESVVTHLGTSYDGPLARILRKV